MAFEIAGLIVSLGVLALTGDPFVVAVARIAGTLRLRPTVVGALVGGFGTSIAELIVAALATLRRSPQLAVGSLVGSIVANVCLALAVAALITPLRVDSGTVRLEAPLSVTSVALFALLAAGGISRTDGVVMLVGLLSRGEIRGVGAFSLWLMTGVVVVSWLAMGRRRVLTRWEAVLLLLAYVAALPFVNR